MKLSLILAFPLAVVATGIAAEDIRPNILWITSEDNGPHLGAYGDEFADTPNLDRLAARGMIYLNAWSTAPVCAPARTTIISGLYPPSTGSQHMRSMTRLPDGMKMFPVYLREAGYYCTNNSKEDYNLEHTGKVWDESSGKAHWRNREPGQRFFAVFNFTTSHESQIRKRPHTPVHDPAKVRVPAYHPDTPEVRRDWAQYYDKITEMDGQVGQVLQQLDDDGLTGETIVFYYGDHGAGMPRSKRWPYNSGLRVPLIVHLPEKFKALIPDNYQVGGETDELVGFIDLAPTVLSLAGIEPPKFMQGRAFAGEFKTPPRPFAFGFRGRMDERYDMVRVVRDKRFIYIRNYMPHKPYGQFIAYMFQTPTTQMWKQMYDAGKLNAVQSAFWQSKAPEELYDLQEDPDEVNNLASSPDHQDILKRLRAAQEQWALGIRDLGFLPEGEMHSRAGESTPYEMGRNDNYPLQRIMDAAAAASSLKTEDKPNLLKALSDDDSAVRYWAALGIVMREPDGIPAELRRALEDESPYVRILAAQAVARAAAEDDLAKPLEILVELADIQKHGVYVSMLALNALDELDDQAQSVRARIESLPETAPGVNRRMDDYVPNLKRKTLADLQSR